MVRHNLIAMFNDIEDAIPARVSTQLLIKKVFSMKGFGACSCRSAIPPEMLESQLQLGRRRRCREHGRLNAALRVLIELSLAEVDAAEQLAARMWLFDCELMSRVNSSSKQMALMLMIPALTSFSETVG